jgi:hypothetical protein
MNKIFQGELDRIAFGKSSSGPFPTTTRPSLPSLPSFLGSVPQESALNKVSHIWIYSGIAQKVALAVFALFIVAIILVFVHFFIRPIFPQSLLTNIPGFKDEKLFWTNGTADIISGIQNPFHNQSSNYTFMVDTQIDYPTATLGAPRLLLYRGDQPCKLTGLKPNETLLTILPQFNFAVHMDKENNDVYVSVMTNTESSTAPESISITNYPVEKPIRLTVVVTDKLMEVYLNGALYKTKTFDGQLNSIKGSIYPIPSIISESSMPFGRIQNLRLWNRVLNANEIRSYGGSSAFPSVMRVADSRSTAQCNTTNTDSGSTSNSIGSLAGLDMNTLFKDTSSAINKLTGQSPSSI